MELIYYDYLFKLQKISEERNVYFELTKNFLSFEVEGCIVNDSLMNISVSVMRRFSFDRSYFLRIVFLGEGFLAHLGLMQQIRQKKNAKIFWPHGLHGYFLNELFCFNILKYAQLGKTLQKFLHSGRAYWIVNT